MKNNEYIFPEKYRKKLPEGYEDKIMQTTSDDIKKSIVESEGALFEIEQEKDADDKLNGARQLAKELGSGYREVKNIETAKIKYCVQVLSERGVKL